MSKTILIMVICLSFATIASAQPKDLKDSRYKKYAGRYGSSSGIVLFEDGTYLLYGYATAVFGTYFFEKDNSRSANTCFAAGKTPKPAGIARSCYYC